MLKPTTPPSASDHDVDEDDVSPLSLEQVVQTVVHVGTAERRRTIGAIVEALEERSAAPVLLLPALVLISPLSGITGVSTLCGLAIAIVASQLLIGRSRIWLPGFIGRRSVPTSRAARLLSRLVRPARIVDRFTHERFDPFTHAPFGLLPGFVCLLSGLFMPLMELVPFSATLMGVAVGAMALGLLVRDGVLILFGLLFAVAIMGGTVTALWAIF